MPLVQHSILHSEWDGAASMLSVSPLLGPGRSHVAQSLLRCDCLVCILRTRSLGGARLPAKVVLLPCGWCALGQGAGQLQLPRYVSGSLGYKWQELWWLLTLRALHW